MILHSSDTCVCDLIFFGLCVAGVSLYWFCSLLGSCYRLSSSFILSISRMIARDFFVYKAHPVTLWNQSHFNFCFFVEVVTTAVGRLFACIFQ